MPRRQHKARPREFEQLEHVGGDRWLERLAQQLATEWQLIRNRIRYS